MRADHPVTPASAAGDDGPAFGSLASLGGPRKFKKKPVLVLDPEELEKAHMMFQDASAELLGEEVQRPERPSSILGLAPMDDEDSSPEDMGAPDEGDDTDDSDIPSAEDLLRIAASRPALGEDDEAAIAAQLEGLDFDHRIFPNLPLKSEDEIVAEEEAERTRAGESDDAEETPLDADLGDPLDEDEDWLPPIDVEHVTADEYLPAEYDADGESDSSEEGESPYYARLDMTPADSPSEAEAEKAPEPQDTDEQNGLGEVLPQAPLFGEAPFLEFPVGPISWQPVETRAQEELTGRPADIETEGTDTSAPAHHTAPVLPEPDIGAEPEQVCEPETEAEAEPAPEHEAEHVAEAEPAPDLERADETECDPAPEFEPEPLPVEFTEAEDRSNRFEWQLEEVTDDGQPVHAKDDTQPEPVGDYEDEYALEEMDGTDGHYTEVHDEPVDGYAFMYAANPRARTLHALAEGESNSLRARLIREREQAEAESERRKSLLAKIIGWLRGLFG